jgi:hypothetical protein
MRQEGVLAVVVVVALALPALAFAQAAPIGAWCGGSYGAEGTNFGECVQGQGGAQVAGEASGISGLSGPTVPQYPASEVTFEDGKALFNKQELNLNWTISPDRSREIQQPGSDGTE